MEFKYAVVIGRFQPFHNEHFKLIEHGLKIAEKVIVVIGSAYGAPTIRNPFSFTERKEMIEDSFSDVSYGRLNIVPVRDYYYSDNAWLRDVQAKTDAFINEGDSVVLLGSFKDDSSAWLLMFPQWEFKHVSGGSINGTDVREILFDHNILADWEGKPSRLEEQADDFEPIAGMVPPKVHLLIWEWMKQPLYVNLCKEWKFTKEYRASWDAAPFPPTFVTTDAVVTGSGHVLVVRRKLNPGKGLLALPGGFVGQREYIEDAALRELKEETGIRLDKQILRSAIVDSHVFDYPSRSLRGRTITHAFHIHLRDGKLPEVKGGDDAAEAFWLPLWDATQAESQWFEDHIHIVNYFTGVGAQGER